MVHACNQYFRAVGGINKDRSSITSSVNTDCGLSSGASICVVQSKNNFVRFFEKKKSCITFAVT